MLVSVLVLVTNERNVLLSAPPAGKRAVHRYRRHHITKSPLFTSCIPIVSAMKNDHKLR